MNDRDEKSKQIIAQIETGIREIQKKISQVPSEAVVTTAEDEIAELFRRIKEEVQQAVVQQEVEQRDAKREPPQCCMCGKKMSVHAHRKRTIYTRNGPLVIRRRYYLCRPCKEGQSPLDAELGLSGEFTTAVDELMCLADCLQSSRLAKMVMKKFAGLSISHTAIHTHAVSAGKKFHHKQITQPPVTKLSKGTKRAYISADGVMVRLQDRLFHEMKLGCFYNQGQSYRQYVATLKDCDIFGEELRSMAHLSGMKQAKQLAVIGDGAPWLWEQARTRFPLADPEIVDFYHAAERIGKAGNDMYGEGTVAAQRFLASYRHQLRHEGGKAVLAKLKRSSRHRAGDEAMHLLVAYMGRNIGRMDYPALKAQGFDIGSGMIESGCKNLVQARLKGSGMRWSEESAIALANLRGMLLSGRWDEQWKALSA